MSGRWAVYLSFAPDDPLNVAAAAWLGRDAFSGAALPRPTLPGVGHLDLDAITADPRRYGFHATLKAPFELADGQSEEALRAAFTGFATARPAFDADIAVRAIGPFIAFTLATPSVPMQALHEACVVEFEPFRAPLSAFDLERRRKAGLSPEREALLLRYGYPGVMQQFRFHMTLTGAIADARERAEVLAALQAHFAPQSGPRRIDHLALFRQHPDRKADFLVDTLVRFEG